jgi:hypothetical protein
MTVAVLGFVLLMLAVVSFASIVFAFLLHQARKRGGKTTPHVQTALALSSSEQELVEHRQIIHEVFAAQRAAIHRLRDSGRIGEAVLRRVERDLDTEERQMMVSVRTNTLGQLSSSGNRAA